ncbi:MAG: DNA polymerase IV [Propionibacteriaceae bacterium]|jgi:DNA polymerase-4|nr:DNA polymerase IV [Propionibacteriaceae bacterium]
MRDTASILHLDLDAFFAAVEQRDKPSLRGKPVIVGGISGRGVVSTCSYEARVFGVHSAMPMHEARRLCPNAAFLSGRFGAYRIASRQVMTILRSLSPDVEPLSLDEAFVDLVSGGVTDYSMEALTELGEGVRAQVHEVTGGLTASVGIGSSKFMAKLGSEAAKPNGLVIIPPGTEADRIADLPVSAIPGVGPATTERLNRLGLRSIADLRRATPTELRHELGQATATWLQDIAYARDDRTVSALREVKSISVEDTFETDYTKVEDLMPMAARDAVLVARRLRKAGWFARTITLKLKLADFTTHARSRTLLGAVDSDETIAEVALSLLNEQRHLLSAGIRLLGVGVSGFTREAQEALFEVSAARSDESRVEIPSMVARRSHTMYRPGDDVHHDVFGLGWVWGTGLGRVTVRFETATTGPGKIHTFALDDPDLKPAPVVPPGGDEDGIEETYDDADE